MLLINKEQPLEIIIEVTSDIAKRIKTIVNEISECCICKEANQMMGDFTNILKNLKFSGEKYNREILLLCENDKNFVKHPVLSKLRNVSYQVLERIFNKKLRKDTIIQINSYEYAMLLMAEMKLLSYQQLEYIKTTYIKFCKKLNLGENELLLKQLEFGLDSNGNNIMDDNGKLFNS